MTQAPVLEFDHIPSIKELGIREIPGLTYALICTQNAIRAAHDGFRPVPNAPYISLAGPKGSAALVLMCEGKPLQGAGAGIPVRLADPDIYSSTGLNPNPDLLGRADQEPTDAEVSTPTPSGAGQVEGSQGDGGVQAWNPSLGQP